MILQSRPEGTRLAIWLYLNPVIPLYQSHIDLARVWRAIADLFAPYPINVATFRPVCEPKNIANVFVDYVPTVPAPHPIGGVAIVNGFFQQSGFGVHPAYVFSKDRSEPELIRCVAHETCHLFGCDHVQDPASVMFPGIMPTPGVIDRRTHTILAARIRA